jgi:hypothetical protein
VGGESLGQATPRPCLKTRRKGCVNGIFQNELWAKGQNNKACKAFLGA